MFSSQERDLKICESFGNANTILLTAKRQGELAVIRRRIKGRKCHSVCV